MAYYQIPVTNQPNQSFRSVVPVNGQNVSLNFYIYWNEPAGYWEMTLQNPATNEDYVTGMALVTGDIPAQNLLGQLAYLQIGSAYVVPINDSGPDYPKVDSWGKDFILVWGE